MEFTLDAEATQSPGPEGAPKGKSVERPDTAPDTEGPMRKTLELKSMSYDEDENAEGFKGYEGIKIKYRDFNLIKYI